VSEIEDPKEALLFTILEFITSSLPANEDDAVVTVPLTVVILAANEELLVFTDDFNPSIVVAADELFVTIVPLNEIILAERDEDAL
jgi:hypothetical protein